MNIVHLSKSDDRGAFIAAYRFHKQVSSAGHNSVLVVAKKTTKDTDVIEVRVNFFEKLYIRFVNLISSTLIKKKQIPDFLFTIILKNLHTRLLQYVKVFLLTPILFAYTG